MIRKQRHRDQAYLETESGKTGRWGVVWGQGSTDKLVDMSPTNKQKRAEGNLPARPFSHSNSAKRYSGSDLSTGATGAPASAAGSARRGRRTGRVRNSGASPPAASANRAAAVAAAVGARRRGAARGTGATSVEGSTSDVGCVTATATSALTSVRGTKASTGRSLTGSARGASCGTD